MKFLVTGAGGYIGRGVTAELLARGHEVVTVGHKPTGLSSESLTEVVGDIFEMPELFSDVHPDTLVHLAWRNGFDHSNVSHLEDLSPHYSFLRGAIDAGIKHIAVMGTMHEVGYHIGAIDENTACNPTTPYGVSKNALRQLTIGMCREAKITCQWMRGFYLVSADGRGESIFAKIVRAAREGKTQFPFTSGRNKYDFLNYSEFSEQVAAVVEQSKVDGIINICSGRPVSLGEQIEDFIAENNLAISLSYGEYPERPYDSPAVWGDSTIINTLLRERGI